MACNLHNSFIMTPNLVVLDSMESVGKFQEVYHVGNFKNREKNNFALPT